MVQGTDGRTDRVFQGPGPEGGSRTLRPVTDVVRVGVSRVGPRGTVNVTRLFQTSVPPTRTVHDRSGRRRILTLQTVLYSPPRTTAEERPLDSLVSRKGPDGPSCDPDLSAEYDGFPAVVG